MVDASVALKWVFKEGGTDEAMALWDRWQEAGERVLAPPIFRFEVTNALHQMVRRGHLGSYDATDLLESLLAVVAVEEPTFLYRRSLGLAAEMWTADLRLCRAVDDRLSLLRCLGL